MLRITLLLCYLAAIQASNAMVVVRNPPQVPPGCAPQTAPLGALTGRLPPGSVGAVVYKLLQFPTTTPTEDDDATSFNRTRLLGPIVNLQRAPYATEPDDLYPTARDGVVTQTPTSAPTRRPITRRLDGEPTEEAEARNLRGQDGDNGRDLNVFLPDTRQEVNVNDYPYRAVGKWRGCTASLVLAPGIVVTNAHCLKYKDDGTMDPSMWSTSFYAGFKNGKFLASSKPKAIWYDKDADYAVLKLWTAIDAQLGRLGVWWRDDDFFDKNRPLKMISYSGDHCTSWDNCRPKLSSGSSRGNVAFSDAVRHDLDAKRGSSGSAMWNYYNGVPVMDALNYAEDRNGGEVSLTLSSYTGSNPNYMKPAGQWKAGYDKVKNF